MKNFSLAFGCVAVLAVGTFAIDRPVVRYIGTEDATSDCIGNPKNSICAAETVLACDARSDLDACRAVGMSDDDFDYPFNPAGRPMQYYLRSVEPDVPLSSVTAGNMASEYQFTFRLRRMSSAVLRQPRWEAWETVFITVIKHGNVWQVVGVPELLLQSDPS